MKYQYPRDYSCGGDGSHTITVTSCPPADSTSESRSSESPSIRCPCSVCVCYLLFINRYMRPATAWRQRRLFKMTMSCPRSKWSILEGHPYPLLPITAKQGKEQPVLSSSEEKKGRLHCRQAQPTLPFVAPVCPIYLLRGCPSSTDAPYPGAPQKSQHYLREIFLPQSLARGGPRVLPPVGLPSALPQPPDLGHPGPAPRKQVMAGPLLYSPVDCGNLL